MVPSQRFKHPELGVVHVIARQNATRFIARWKGNELQLTIPARSSLSEVNRAIENLKSRLLAIRPSQRIFQPGWCYSTPEKDIVIEKGTIENRFTFRDEPSVFTICIPSNFEFLDSERITNTVNHVLDLYATRTASSVLLPMAHTESVRLGVKPRSWIIGRGENRRGSCSADGRIRLSRNLVFFPHHLRRFVICHELAHLTHFDHSPAFHRLLDRYLDGHETELSAQANAHLLPFIR